MVRRFHRNLHAARSGKPQWVETARGRVVTYHSLLRLDGVSTRIQPTGALRCRESGVRRVCAFLDAEQAKALDAWPTCLGEGWERLSYDPRVDTAFHAGGEPFDHAEAVVLLGDGSAWVYGATYQVVKNRAKEAQA